MPVSAEYCAKKILVKKFLKATPPEPTKLAAIATQVAAQHNRVIDFILNDLLLRKSPSQCLQNFKRYMQIAEQLLQEGHADAATVIISALTNPVIARLEIEKNFLPIRLSHKFCFVMNCYI